MSIVCTVTIGRDHGESYKTAEPVKMPFGGHTRVAYMGTRNHEVTGCKVKEKSGGILSGKLLIANFQFWSTSVFSRLLQLLYCPVIRIFRHLALWARCLFLKQAVTFCYTI